MYRAGDYCLMTKLVPFCNIELNFRLHSGDLNYLFNDLSASADFSSMSKKPLIEEEAKLYLSDLCQINSSSILIQVTNVKHCNI